ncbi:MAG: response regulator transcription factor [Gemmatimonadaceae bacterium]|nr:response regulator transcription factor [Gemmatimonadaceae bacterium]
MPDDRIHLTLGAMPAVVRARLGAGFIGHEAVLLDDGRAHRAPRPHAAHAVYVTEWPNADEASGPRTPTIHLVDPGVHPPATQLARGSTAWLPLDCDADDVVAAAHAVLRGLTVVAPSVLPPSGAPRDRTPRRELRAELPDAADGDPRLTDRELEVLRALAEGLGNKQIGGRLGISPSTVKYHLQAIFAKLAVRTRSEAVSYGLRHGIVPL